MAAACPPSVWTTARRIMVANSSTPPWLNAACRRRPLRRASRRTVLLPPFIGTGRPSLSQSAAWQPSTVGRSSAFQVSWRPGPSRPTGRFSENASTRFGVRRTLPRAASSDSPSFRRRLLLPQWIPAAFEAGLDSGWMCVAAIVVPRHRLDRAEDTGPASVRPGRLRAFRGHGRRGRSGSGFLNGRWWARLGLNQRPLACEASALPLSYAPNVRQSRPWSVACQAE